MPWVKGQSGNPGGRPKAEAEVRQLAQQETVANVKALKRIRDAASSPPAAVVAAVSVLFDRAFGKPVQEHELRHRFPVTAAADADLAAIAFAGSSRSASSEADQSEPEGVVH